jgi:hypothetical protein
MADKLSRGTHGIHRELERAQIIQFPHLVDTKEAARLLGRPPDTLKRWRYEGVGPDWITIEGKVMYDIAVLLEYVRQNTRVASVRAAAEVIS